MTLYRGRPAGDSAAINESITAAKAWQQNLLTRCWDPELEPHETARVCHGVGPVIPCAKPSLVTVPAAFRAIACSVMDGQEDATLRPSMSLRWLYGCSTLNRVSASWYCSSGTRHLPCHDCHPYLQATSGGTRTTPDDATNEQILRLKTKPLPGQLAIALGCEIDPFLAVTSRMNLLFTTGNPGRIFRIDARTFPDGRSDGIEGCSPGNAIG